MYLKFKGWRVGICITAEINTSFIPEVAFMIIGTLFSHNSSEGMHSKLLAKGHILRQVDHMPTKNCCMLLYITRWARSCSPNKENKSCQLLY